MTPDDLTPRERFLRACRREPVDRVPSWLMRQAGRYMPEYQAIRSGMSFLDLCKNPELCRDVTMQPLDVLGLEMGIIFSDILLPAEAMGLDLTFGDGGPKISNPVRDRAAVETLDDFDPSEKTPWPAQAIRLTVESFGPDRPLLGFCGAPFTMASYMIEGKGSRQYENLKRLLYGEPDTLHLLLERITDNLIPYLRAQIAAGAAAVQVFDSWAGSLGQEEYAEFAHSYTTRLIAAVKETGVPVISYVNGGAHLIERMATSGADVISLDWRVDPADARRRVGDLVALQGNMDPGALLASPEAATRETRRNLDAFGGAPGHIFNLGSGVMKWTPVESARACVDAVREWRPA